MNKAIDLKTLQLLAQEVMLELDPIMIQHIQTEFNIILAEMKVVNSIDTSNVKPTHYCNPHYFNTLRTDQIEPPLTLEQVAVNAPVFNPDGYIMIDPVIQKK